MLTKKEPITSPRTQTMPDTGVFVQAEAQPKRNSIVRSATLVDLETIVRIELDSFADVYGERPSDGVVQSVRDKYEGRIKLLGSWVRVLESPEFGVYGVLVCCPTNYGREEFMGETRDLTSNGTLQDIYDPRGNNIYVVNLAIRRDAQGRGARKLLFANAIKKAVGLGIQHAYFESRLPDFRSWLEAGPMKGRTKWDKATVRKYAEQYWKLTDKTPDGVKKPVDRLLRMYTNFGCVPLRLVDEAWTLDSPSMGFGVLCEFTPPYRRLLRGIGNTRKFARWIAVHKKTLFWLTTIAVALAYSALSSSLDETMAALGGAAIWFLPAYFGSWIIMLSGIGMMLYGVGKKVSFANLFLRPGKELRAAAAKLPEFSKNKLVQSGFIINLIGALGAAGVVIGAMLHSMPPGPGLIAAAPAIVDAYATITLRIMLIKAIKKRRLQ